MIAPDASVLVAALAPWHEAHAAARAALADARRAMISHVAFETTAVLSGMPDGRRVSPAVALNALMSMFPGRWVALGGAEAQRVLERAIANGVRGGALYDALIAATAARHEVHLVSADRRARKTYEALAVEVTYIESAARA